MPRHANRKAAARAYAKEHGVSYTEALRVLNGKDDHEDPAAVPVVGFQFDAAVEAGVVPFATSVAGDPVVFDPSVSGHLLVSGPTGSGKSALVRNLLYGALVDGWDCHVVDPTKAGADLTFAATHCTRFATDRTAAVEVMVSAVREVDRRRALLDDRQVGQLEMLDEESRPPRMMVLIDEAAWMWPGAAGDAAEKLVRQGRAMGVTVVLASQHPAGRFGPEIRNNVAECVLGPRWTGNGPGSGMWEPTPGSSVQSTSEEVRVWFASPETIRVELEARMPSEPNRPAPEAQWDRWWEEAGRFVDDHLGSGIQERSRQVLVEALVAGRQLCELEQDTFWKLEQEMPYLREVEGYTSPPRYAHALLGGKGQPVALSLAGALDAVGFPFSDVFDQVRYVLGDGALPEKPEVVRVPRNRLARLLDDEEWRAAWG